MIVNYIVDSQGTTLLVHNFAILVRQYFAGFHCQDLNKKIWKKNVNFLNSSILNIISLYIFQKV